MHVLAILGTALALGAATPSFAGPPTLALSSNTFSGGGGTSAGGDFHLSGTIGQPDASVGSLVGAAFSLDGGFWPAADTALTCPADFNGDGFVDSVDLLGVLSGWGLCDPPCPQDIDGNGQVDLADLLALLSAWGTCEEEPWL